ncbi:MAG: hypothetical protein KIT14_04555 [bacterium]|nr:hypothetical protein [bacterium]
MPRARRRRIFVDGEPLTSTVLPSQYFRGDRRAELQPEKRLMLAVLEDAITLYIRHPELAAESVAWVESDDIGWPYAFGNVCDALGLDRDAVRTALRRRRAERTAPRFAA